MGFVKKPILQKQTEMIFDRQDVADFLFLSFQRDSRHALYVALSIEEDRESGTSAVPTYRPNKCYFKCSVLAT
jgi:hypothetical protein